MISKSASEMDPPAPFLDIRLVGFSHLEIGFFIEYRTGQPHGQRNAQPSEAIPVEQETVQEEGRQQEHAHGRQE